MKRRIQIDSAILSFFIILTGFLYQCPRFYFQTISMDDTLDFVGLIAILTGIFLRMAGRGFKKANSDKSHQLVMSGPYSIVRNPMYLGSFLLGVGFVFLVWPWWSLPIFIWLFYMRFQPQIVKEEDCLHKMFGKTFEGYIHKVPRMFPKLKTLLKMNLKRTFPEAVLWTTKEKWGLVGWPVLAMVLESFQEKLVFGFTDLHHTMYLTFMAMIIFTVALWGMYRYA